jgi:cardiolipin synthase
MTTSTRRPRADTKPKRETTSALTLPNALTFARIAAVPALIGLFYLEPPEGAFACFGVFVAASVTDFFDGYLARRLNRLSDIGRVLDPIADKLLVAAALVMLVAFEQASPIAVAAILCRELLVSGLREALAGRVALPVTWLAKWKTASQMAALALLLIAPGLGIDAIASAGEGALWLAVGLSWATAIDYLRHAWRAIAGHTSKD